MRDVRTGEFEERTSVACQLYGFFHTKSHDTKSGKHKKSPPTKSDGGEQTHLCTHGRDKSVRGGGSCVLVARAQHEPCIAMRRASVPARAPGSVLVCCVLCVCRGVCGVLVCVPTSGIAKLLNERKFARALRARLCDGAPLARE
jgi:hypothetical protein